MRKPWKRVKLKVRQIKYEWWKKKFEKYTAFEVVEDNKSFIISLNFRTKTDVVVKEEISAFIQECLKKQEIDIITTLELTEWIYNVRYKTEGVDGNKVLLFFEELNP